MTAKNGSFTPTGNQSPTPPQSSKNKETVTDDPAGPLNVGRSQSGAYKYAKVITNAGINSCEHLDD